MICARNNAYNTVDTFSQNTIALSIKNTAKESAYVSIKCLLIYSHYYIQNYKILL